MSYSAGAAALSPQHPNARSLLYASIKYLKKCDFAGALWSTCLRIRRGAVDLSVCRYPTADKHDSALHFCIKSVGPRVAYATHHRA